MSALTFIDDVHDDQALTDGDINNQATANWNIKAHLIKGEDDKITISRYNHALQRYQQPHCDAGYGDVKMDNNFMAHIEANVGDYDWNTNFLISSDTSNHDTEKDVLFGHPTNNLTNAKNGAQSDSLEKANRNSSSLTDDVNLVQQQCKTRDKNHRTRANVHVDGEDGNNNLEAQSGQNELEGGNNLPTHSDVNNVDNTEDNVDNTEDNVDNTEDNVDNTEDNVDGLKRILKCAFGHLKPSDKDGNKYVSSNSQQTVASNDKLHLIENNIQTDVHSKKTSSIKHSWSCCEPSRKHFEQSQQEPKNLNHSEPRLSYTSKTDQVENPAIVPTYLKNTENTVSSSTSVAIPMEPENKPKVSTIRNDDEDSYNFSHEQRGYMIIVVNDRFVRQNHRDGAHWDLLKMKEIARKLGFRIFNIDMERNLDKPKLMEILKNAQTLDHSTCDTFAFAISTHGLEKESASANGKQLHALVCADDQLIFTSTIFEMFNDENCPSLKNKPKLFFIQACRGEHQDAGREVYVIKNDQHIDKYSRRLTRTENTDHLRADDKDTLASQDSCTAVPVAQMTSVNNPYTGYLPKAQRNILNTNATNYNLNGMPIMSSPPSPKPQAAFVRPPVDATPSLLCDNDMVVLYAIPPGMFAWRNTNDGSWMIDFLHQVLMEYDMRKPKTFLNLLTKVSAMMSKRMTNVPAIPKLHAQTAVSVVEHKTTKDIIFYQKTQLSNWVRNTKA